MMEALVKKKTLINILLVGLLVLGLGALLMPTAGSPTPRKVAETRVTLRNAAAAATAYQADFGEWPTSLAAINQNRSNWVLLRWSESGSNDGWGRPIQFRPVDSALGRGSVLSFGRDGCPGGKGLDEDIEERFGPQRQGR